MSELAQIAEQLARALVAAFLGRPARWRALREQGGV